MIGLSWNCRGLGHPLAIPSICELTRAHRPDVVFLFETLTHKNKVEEVRSRIGFEGCFVVDSIGRSGGICVLWKLNDTCNLLSYSNNHIDLRYKGDEGEWRITGFYGFPQRDQRRRSWNLLRRLSRSSTLPWAIIGDFNDLLNSNEKRGAHDHPNWLFTGFRDAVMDSGLSDLHLQGYPFTWFKSRGKPTTVEERLDRCMVNNSWLGIFPNASLQNITTPISDHTALLLKTLQPEVAVRRKRFRFENKWLQEPEIPDIVANCWTNRYGVK